MRDETIWIAIIAETPLSLGTATSQSNFITSAEAIHGSVVRGAVAEALLQEVGNPHHRLQCSDDACPFCTLFGDNRIQFGNAYLGDYAPVWPLPLTARTCKQYSGFVTDDPLVNARRHHGVHDLLLADLAYGIAADPAFPQRDALVGDAPLWHPADDPPLRDELDTCGFDLGAGAACSHALDRAHGWYQWRARPQRVDPPPIERHTHVGINRARNVAEDGLLFAQEQIDLSQEQRAFFARIRVPAERADVLRSALERVQRIGRGRSRGLGAVQVRTIPAPSYADVATRVTAFAAGVGRALRPYARQLAQLPDTTPGVFFSLTLRAPAMVLDALGNAVRVPPPSALGLPFSSTPVAAYARMQDVGGWDAAAGKPRRTRQAVQAGSVFLYYTAAPTGVDDVVAGLTQLEQNGIGRWRERGYGALTVCADFHVMQARGA